MLIETHLICVGMCYCILYIHTGCSEMLQQKCNINVYSISGSALLNNEKKFHVLSIGILMEQSRTYVVLIWFLLSKEEI